MRLAPQCIGQLAVAALALEHKICIKMHGGPRSPALIDFTADPVLQPTLRAQQRGCQSLQSGERQFVLQRAAIPGQLEDVDMQRLTRGHSVAIESGDGAATLARAMVRPQIVLASTSRYRRELLQRLRLEFDMQAPDVDESALAGESPRETALRLALAKARAVHALRPDCIVIGSDQVAELEGAPLGKPLEHGAALAQLERMQGKEVVFHTALAVVGPRRNEVQVDIVPTTVHMRTLPRAALEQYLRIDEPYDCAGAAKIESLGIALVDRVQSDDPTALIGLPLIRLTAMLEAAGVPVLPMS